MHESPHSGRPAGDVVLSSRVMADESIRVICIGMLTVDVVAGPVGEIRRNALDFIDAVEMHPGGCALNTAIHLSTLGVPAAIVGPLGDDPYGEFLRRKAREAGLDASGLRTYPEIATSATVILMRPDRQRDILQCPGSNAALRGDMVDLAAFPGATHLHIGGYFTCDGFDGEDAARLVRRARAAGLRTSLDTAWDPRGRWLAALRPVLPALDVLSTNEDEGRALTGLADPRAIVDALIAEGPAVVVLKLGAAGCVVRTPDACFAVPACEVDVVDTTGGGDAFAAGFLAGQVWGDDLRRSARIGCAAGGRACEAIGAIVGVTSRAAVLELVADDA